MRQTIRPNSLNPDWPTEPDPKDLADELKRAKKAKDPNRAKKEAPAKALRVTQRRVAAQHRVGAGGPTENLDWLDWMRLLREAVRDPRPNPKERQWCWIDGDCPEPTETIVVRAIDREGRWRQYGDEMHRYVYVTFEVVDG